MFRVWLGTADHKVVGDFLGDVRRKAGVTQDELALRLKKPQSFVSSYERGQRRIDLIEFTTIVITAGQEGQYEAEVATTVKRASLSDVVPSAAFEASPRPRRARRRIQRWTR